MTRITMGGLIHLAKPARDGWPPSTLCGSMDERYYETSWPVTCPTCKRILKERRGEEKP